MSRSLRARLIADLPVAMKARDQHRVAVLRTTLAALSNAEAVDPSVQSAPVGLLGDVARRDLTDQDVERIVVAERDEHRALAEEMRRLGQDAEAAACATRAAVLDGYLR